MKRVLFLSSVMFMFLSAVAQQVSRQEAINAAVNTMKYNGRTNLTKSSVSSVNSKNNGDTVLIFEVLFQSGEKVLLSGNKACIPVLGYSLPTGVCAPQSILDNYADIPDGLRDMIEDYEEQILYCFRNNLTSSHSEEWQLLQYFESGRAVTIDIVSPLLTTEWGQSYSNDWGWDCNAYNYYVSATHDSCNCDTHQKCPTGCVATAMAQIMKYWNYPVWMPGKTEQYDWCNMPDELIYFGNSKYIKERNAVARLMRDCGTAVNTDYCNPRKDECSSSASTSYIPNALESFGYSECDHKWRIFHQNNWISLLEADLDRGYPVCYRGYDKTIKEGHSFVCDGYRSDNTFHFNWGWNGFCNMWCTVDQLNPSFYTLNFAFNSQQAAVFNIHPSGTQDYCNFELPLWMHYHIYYNAYGNTTPDPYANVPKTFTRLTSVPNNSDYPASWRTIPSGATSEYAAHEEVLLQDGFYAEPGSDFLAHIVPCEPCEEARTTDYTSDMVGEGADNPADTLVVPKSFHTETMRTADDAALNVYPNPTDDLLYIELTGAEISNITLYDLQGRIIYSPNSPNSPMNMRNVPAGVYVLRVTGADGREYHQKIVKK